MIAMSPLQSWAVVLMVLALAVLGTIALMRFEQSLARWAQRFGSAPSRTPEHESRPGPYDWARDGL